LNSVDIYCQNARFATDVNRFRGRFPDTSSIPSYAIGDEWIIKGQKMKYGTGEISVETTPGIIDTIFYKATNRNAFDTLICYINAGNKYKFYYNDCCGAFNVENISERKFIRPAILFDNSRLNDRLYLGTLGEGSKVLLSQNWNDTLTSQCSSAMAPSVMLFQLLEIEESNHNGSSEFYCLSNNQADKKEFRFNYIQKELKMEFLYLPLSKEPLKFGYSSKNKNIFFNHQ